MEWGVGQSGKGVGGADGAGHTEPDMRSCWTQGLRLYL